MKIYIAGPMTGHENWNFLTFFETQQALEGLGHEVINPAQNDGKTLGEAIANVDSPSLPRKSWGDYMRIDLRSVLAVDAVCVLDGWRNSKGATLEVHVAEELGLPIYILKDGELQPRITIIGVAGWARSGKDTVADHLVSSHGYTKFSFATPMREALYRLNPKITVNEVQSTPIRIGVDVYDWEGLKERSPDVRVLLQRFGTEVGREMFGEDFWVNYALDSIPDGTKAVIADVRYPNEADAIKKLGGKVFRVRRNGVVAANEHASESALNDYEFDSIIDNNADIHSLQSIVNWTIKL
jgi:hypothetical protein